MSNEIVEFKQQTVVVLGASNKPHRYAYKAISQLVETGHKVLPVHPKLETVQDLPVYTSLELIDEPVDTLTLYVGAARSQPLIESVVALNPGRVIFNPGSESEPLAQALSKNDIPYEMACTLVLLRTGVF